MCDGSIPYYGIGVIRESVTFRVEAGFVCSIEGGEQAGVLDDLLAAQDDEWVYNLAQFAFGLNPDCVEFTGGMLNDEGINGTVHDADDELADHRHGGSVDPSRRYDGS